jgi:hypothetical protein
MSEPKNPILYYIGDTPIRKYNSVRVSMNEHEMAKLATIKSHTGLNLAQILALQGKSCSKCGNDNVDFVVTVPRNIISLSGRDIKETAHHLTLAHAIQE